MGGQGEFATPFPLQDAFFLCIFIFDYIILLHFNDFKVRYLIIPPPPGSQLCQCNKKLCTTKILETTYKIYIKKPELNYDKYDPMTQYFKFL